MRVGSRDSSGPTRHREQAGTGGSALLEPPNAGGGSTPTDPSPSSSGGNGLTRVTVNLNRHAVQALDTVSDATGYSKTDTINRALQVYAIVQEIMEKNGGALNVRHNNGDIERIHIV